MPEQTLEETRARLLAEAEQLPGVTETMRLYHMSIDTTRAAARAEAVIARVAAGANTLTR